MKRRLFISLDLPEDIKDSIEREVEKIRYQFTDDIRFMDRNQWHITVTFLGQQEDEAVGRILSAIRRTAGDFKAPTIEFSDISYGPKKGNPRTQEAEQSSHDGTPRMIWLNGSVDSSKNLQKLKDALENNLVDDGVVFGREHRQFNIHITLARFMSAENLPELNLKFEKSFSVPTIDLVESYLSREGTKYEFLQKTDFQLE